jgi:hypothetical protein
MTIPYVKTALAALIFQFFYYPSLHVYEPSGKSFLDFAAALQLRGDLSEVAQNGVDCKDSLRLFSQARRPRVFAPGLDGESLSSND